MPTSGAPSRLPPNQAATRPEGVSSMVEAWLEAKDGEGTMNSDAEDAEDPAGTGMSRGLDEA